MGRSGGRWHTWVSVAAGARTGRPRIRLCTPSRRRDINITRTHGGRGPPPVRPDALLRRCTPRPRGPARAGWGGGGDAAGSGPSCMQPPPSALTVMKSEELASSTRSSSLSLVAFRALCAGRRWGQLAPLHVVDRPLHTHHPVPVVDGAAAIRKVAQVAATARKAHRRCSRAALQAVPQRPSSAAQRASCAFLH